MAELNVYLTFNGNAREAMTFYQESLGGTMDINTFGESPGNEQMDEATKNQVMHARLVNGDFLLMASDIGTMHPHVTTGTSVTLSLNCLSKEEIESAFAKLSAGGTVTMPLENTFWGATFGMFTDKFGMHWMLNYDHVPQK
jgi:PhnB protein